MRRFNLLIGIAIFTFSIGVALVWFWLSFSKLPSASFDSPPTEETISTSVLPELPIKPLSEQVQIKFLSSEKRNAPGYIFVTFQIANGSAEILYYTGYSKDWHCSYKIKRAKKVEQQERLCTCGNGLAERALSPGETATYDVAVLLQYKTNKIEVGFDFEVGQERRKETIWTDEVVVKK
jgi:hypothetical protein